MGVYITPEPTQILNIFFKIAQLLMFYVRVLVLYSDNKFFHSNLLFIFISSPIFSANKLPVAV